MATSTNTNVHYLYDDSDLMGSIEAPTVKAVTVTYSIGAETTARTVSCQFLRGGVAVTTPVFAHQYLATAASGQALATPPSGTVVAGTNGTILVDDTAKVLWQAVSEANGTLDIVITEVGAVTFYLITVLPSGFIAASSAIAFAA